jgi:hypothetical protein
MPYTDKQVTNLCPHAEPRWRCPECGFYDEPDYEAMAGDER